jgi:ADP-ribose pyrophosphatase
MDYDKDQIEVMAEGKYFRMVRQGKWEYIQPECFTDVVLIIPITDDGKVVLVEQYRVPVGRRVFELPAGLVGDHAHHKDEDIVDAARRELLEETGYRARTMEVLTDGAPSAGSNSVILTVLRATGLEKVAPGGGDHTEDIIVHEVRLAEVPAWLEEKRQQGAVVDLKVYAGLFLAGNR